MTGKRNKKFTGTRDTLPLIFAAGVCGLLALNSSIERKVSEDLEENRVDTPAWANSVRARAKNFDAQSECNVTIQQDNGAQPLKFHRDDTYKPQQQGQWEVSMDDSVFNAWCIVKNLNDGISCTYFSDKPVCQQTDPVITVRAPKNSDGSIAFSPEP